MERLELGRQQTQRTVSSLTSFSIVVLLAAVPHCWQGLAVFNSSSLFCDCVL